MEEIQISMFSVVLLGFLAVVCGWAIYYIFIKSNKE